VDYTYLRTEVLDSNIAADELPNEPEHSVGVRTVFTSPWYDTQLTAAFRWRSGVIPEGSGTGLLTFVDASHHTDPSYQLSVRLAQPLADVLRLPFGAVRLHFDALNVTNERREDSYAVRGRSFIAGISGEFSSDDISWGR
jgi:outer membrane receptor protein involved in Fe transport